MNTETKIKIVRQLVIDSVKMGYTVSINGWKYAIKNSINVNEIVDVLMNTDSDEIVSSMMNIVYDSYYLSKRKGE